MKKMHSTVGGIVAILASGLAIAQTSKIPEAAAPNSYNVNTTTIENYLGESHLNVIFVKYLPELAANPQIGQAKRMTLIDLSQYFPEMLSEELLASIDKDLQALPKYYSVSTTTIGDYLASPPLYGLLEKHFPEVANSPMLRRAREMTLPDLQRFMPMVLTADKLTAVDDDMKTLPQQ